MHKTDLLFYSAYELKQLMLKKTLSPVELTQHFLRYLEQINPHFHFFITITTETALKSAQWLQEQKQEAADFPLYGIPLALLDTLDVQDYPTTFGSKTLKNHRASEDNPEIKLIKAAGATILGKVNLSEFFFYPVSENRLLPPSLNPWNETVSTGNTAAAAAVSMGCIPICLTGDIHAGARVPSSFCGVFGLKLTRGKIPLIRKDLIPISEKSFYQQGIITRHVKDAALMLDTLLSSPLGFCKKLFKYPHLKAALQEECCSYRLGWSKDLGFISVHPTIQEEMQRALITLQSNGHCIETIHLRLDEGTLLHYQHILAADRLFPLLSLKQQNGQTLDFLCDYTESWIQIGKAVTGMEYSLGLIHMEWLKSEIDRVFEPYDFLITPTVYNPPFSLLHSPKISSDKQKINPSLLYSAFTLPFNISGHPAMNIPIGTTQEGYPIGMQVIGKPFSEEKMIQFASSLEKIFCWPDKISSFFTKR